MAVNLSPIWGAGAQLFDNSGNVLSGGKIYTYAAGTTTPATTYTSSNGITANSNPIILNSAGRVPYEIWLSDTVAYKFVLKDSNDTLIATYDNLVGINSNFIAYTAQQEIQTATAGQTVFNLTTMQYQPGTNNLSVFVDGVNQYGPGAQYAYVETDTDTVTFVSGLHAGASVKFTTASPVAGAVMNAENVAYDPPFFGAVGTNVEAKLAQTVSVKDFGAVGDGVTDDTAAIQAAGDSLPDDGGEIYFDNGTFLISDVTFTKPITLTGNGSKSTIIKTSSTTGDVVTLTAFNSTIQNIGFDCASNRTSGAYIKTDGAWHTTLTGLGFQRYYIAVDIDNTIQCTVSDCWALDGTPSGTAADGAIVRVGKTAYCGGIFLQNIEADVNVAANQPSNGILLHYVDHITIDGVLIIHHTNALHVAPENGQFTALMYVSNSSFDTSQRGILIEPATGANVLRCTIADTWAGSNTADGVQINGVSGTVDGVHFTGLMAIGNTQIGVNVVGANAKNITFVNSQGAGNGGNGFQVTAGANATWDGGVLGATDAAGGNGSDGAGIDGTSTGAIINCRMNDNVIAPISNLNPTGFSVAGNTPYGWQSYASTITSEVGTITSANGMFKYKQVNKTVHWSLVVNIVDNGTGAGSVIATLPFACESGNDFIACGRETSSTGKMLQGLITSGTSVIRIYNYDNTYPGANGYRFIVSGTYATA